MGNALNRIPEIRKFFGKSVTGTEPIDFMKEDYLYPTNHAIAARITAENPDEGFKPTSGKIERESSFNQIAMYGDIFLLVLMEVFTNLLILNLAIFLQLVQLVKKQEKL